MYFFEIRADRLRAQLLGVPPADILPVSKIIAVKIAANEFVAFDTIATNAKANPEWVSERAELICR